VVEAFPVSDTAPVRITYMCDCGRRGLKVLTADQWKKLGRQWKDWLSKSKYSYDTEAVGRTVQGFRLELDAISTVEDIELVWASVDAPKEAYV
jgi:hypothetical protein